MAILPGGSGGECMMPGMIYPRTEEDMEICVKKIPFTTLGSSFPYSDLLSPLISYTYLDLLFQNVLTRSISYKELFKLYLPSTSGWALPGPLLRLIDHSDIWQFPGFHFQSAAIYARRLRTLKFMEILGVLNRVLPYQCHNPQEIRPLNFRGLLIYGQ